MAESVNVRPGTPPDPGVDGDIDRTLEALLGRLTLRRWSQCAWHARSLVELLDFVGREMAHDDEDRGRMMGWRASAERLSNELRAVAERRQADAAG